MVIAHTSSESSSDGEPQPTAGVATSSCFQLEVPEPRKLHLIAGGLLAWSLLVGLWATLETCELWRCVSAWQAGTPPPSVGARSSPCPCSCEQGPNDDTHLRREFEMCAAGEVCFFGKNWCSRSIPAFVSSAQTSQPVLGQCWKERCGGPRGVESFNVTCDRSVDPPFSVGWLVRNFPEKIRRMLSFGARGVNHHMNSPGGAMDSNGLRGVSLRVSEDLIGTLNAQLDGLSLVWLIGCWPPARYLVASGMLTVKSGWVQLAAAGITLQVDLANVLVYIKDMRVEIVCPQGTFTLDGFGDGAKTSKPLTAKSFTVDDSTYVSGVQCRGGWGLFCWMVHRLAQAALVRTYLPSVLVYVFLGFAGLQIAPGCDLSRNSFALLPYADKDCCEEPYLTDQSGCLVGGQFNGRFVPGQILAQGVQCKYNEDIRAFRADCVSIPGSYTEKAPGVCTEAELPWHAPSTPGFDGQLKRAQISEAVQRLLLGELAIVTALVAPLVAAVMVAMPKWQHPQQREWKRIPRTHSAC